MANEQVTSWQGLLPNDIFKVTNQKGTFAFVHAVIDTDTKETLWVTGIGGPKGRSMTRSFFPERVIVPSSKVLQKQKSAKSADSSKKKER